MMDKKKVHAVVGRFNVRPSKKPRKKSTGNKLRAKIKQAQICDTCGERNYTHKRDKLEMIDWDEALA